MTPAEAARFLEVPLDLLERWESGAEQAVSLLEEAVRARFKAAQVAPAENPASAPLALDEDFALALKAEMARLKALGWPQSLIADALGVSRDNLIRWAHRKIENPKRATRVGALAILRSIQTYHYYYRRPQDPPFTQAFVEEIDRLKRLRWKQGQIAAFLDVAAHSIFLWKKGRSVPATRAARLGVVALLKSLGAPKKLTSEN